MPFVWIGVHAELTTSVDASTTTEVFVAHEMMNSNGLVRRSLAETMSVSTGYGSAQGAVVRPPRLGPQAGPGKWYTFG